MSRIVPSPLNKRNLSWPMQMDSSGYRRATFLERYEAALMHLAKTPKGSYLHDPNYGNLFSTVRTQGLVLRKDGDLAKGIPTAMSGEASAVTYDFQRAVAMYIPDIAVTAVDYLPDPDNHAIKITIHWAIRGGSSLSGESSKPRPMEVSV